MDAPKVALMLKGMGRIDRRSRAARDVLKWQQDLATDPVRIARTTRIATASRTKLLLDDLDAFLLEGKILFTKRTLGRIQKLVDLRQRMVESLDRTMAQLGETKRGQAPPADPAVLDDYVKRRYSGRRRRTEQHGDGA